MTDGTPLRPFVCSQVCADSDLSWRLVSVTNDRQPILIIRGKGSSVCWPRFVAIICGWNCRCCHDCQTTMTLPGSLSDLISFFLVENARLSTPRVMRSTSLSFAMKTMPKAVNATAVPTVAIRDQTDLRLKTVWSLRFTTGDIARVAR